MRVAIAPTSPGSPRTNRRTSSRKRPFHSDQRRPGNEPSWYRPAASQASAISLVSPSSSASSASATTGGFGTTRQHRREVEAEAVDVEVLDPVAQAVEDQLRRDRVVRVDRVAAARV